MSWILDGIARRAPKPVEVGRAGRRGFREGSGRREAGLALALSVFFPGAGHVYAGRWLRGLVWTVLYLGLVLPAWIFSYMIWAPFSGAALWLTLGLLAFLLLCGTGASRLARRGGRARGSEARAAPPPPMPVRPWVLGSYASILLLGAGLELFGFLGSCLCTLGVKSSSLEPLLSKGDQVKVLLSSYVRPVHGDVVLFRSSPRESGRALGRVLAKAGDTLSLRGGKVIVNGLELDLERNDQRWELEQAGRKERSRRLLSPLPPLRGEGPLPWKDPSGGGLSADWGPFLLPRDRCIVIPDIEGDLDLGGSNVEARWTEAVLVPKRDTLGRVLFGCSVP